MDRDLIFDRINEMLEDSKYPLEISDISDLEGFLNDFNNENLESYDEIKRLYDMLIDEPDTDESFYM